MREAGGERVRGFLRRLRLASAAARVRAGINRAGEIAIQRGDARLHAGIIDRRRRESPRLVARLLAQIKFLRPFGWDRQHLGVVVFRSRHPFRDAQIVLGEIDLPCVPLRRGLRLAAIAATNVEPAATMRGDRRLGELPIAVAV